MKKTFNLLMAGTIFTLLLLSCEKDDAIKKENIPHQGKIAFNLNLESSSLKSTAVDDFSALSNAVISIETAAGDSTFFNLEKIRLFRIGTALYTEEISLPMNDYVLTQFFLQDSMNNTLYACPQEGSEQEQNVNDPLPIEFSVLPAETTPVSVEVLSTENHTPEDFGFSYFEVNFVKTFKFEINAVDSETSNPIGAKVEITSGSSYSFTSKIDSLRFNTIEIRDGYENYSITVSKEGYTEDSISISGNSLKDYIDSPLSFILEPIRISLQPSIVLDYQLDRNAFDTGVNGYDLNVSNAEFCKDRFGRDSLAYFFNGQAGLTSYDKTIINQSGPQSLTVWFKTPSLNQAEYGGQLITLVGSQAAGEGSRFSLNIRNGYLRANYGDGYDEVDGMWHDRLVTDATYNDGQWHLAVLVSDGDSGQLSLYVDGEMVSNFEATRSNNNQIQGLDIKIGGDNFKNYFIGSIDEVVLYDKALKEDEIRYLFNKQ